MAGPFFGVSMLDFGGVFWRSFSKNLPISTPPPRKSTTIHHEFLGSKTLSPFLQGALQGHATPEEATNKSAENQWLVQMYFPIEMTSFFFVWKKNNRAVFGDEYSSPTDPLGSIEAVVLWPSWSMGAGRMTLENDDGVKFWGRDDLMIFRHGIVLPNLHLFGFRPLGFFGRFRAIFCFFVSIMDDGQKTPQNMSYIDFWSVFVGVFFVVGPHLLVDVFLKSVSKMFQSKQRLLTTY